MGIFGSSRRYDTTLKPEEENAFQDWAAKQNRLSDLVDYDLRGAYHANALAAANGHLPDTYKKPNHPTFSTESQYSTPDNPGGQWVEDGKGGWVFWASPANLQHRTLSALVRYFNEVEQGNTLIAPVDWRLQGRR